MGRSPKKNIEDQSMDSSLSLFQLPNEILQIILTYLSTGDTILAFGNINSDRIQALIQHNLMHFDLASIETLSDEEYWIKKYLLNQSHHPKSLCLTNKQINHLVKSNIEFSQLTSIHIIHIEDNRLFQFDLDRMAPMMHSLTLDFLSIEMSHDSIGCLARIIFNQRKRWQTQLTDLHINHIYLPFGFDCLRSMPNLRHLTINLRYDNQLLDLCSYLPCLESFRVDIQHSSFDPSFDHVHVSPYLRKLIISGHFSSPIFLYKFILLYQSSLVNLKLMNIVHPILVDGYQLRNDLVQHLSPTIQFQFHLQISLNRQQTFDLKAYRKTFHWQPIKLEQRLDDDDDDYPILIVSSIRQELNQD